jgi:5-(carboxyamino)imidazole ribonucleotide mutase
MNMSDQGRCVGNETKSAKIALIMGSRSDWPVISHASDILTELNIKHDSFVISAHRTPQRLYEFATASRAKGYEVIIAAAGGAAHLPGMCASMTTVPVLGVPVAVNEGLLGIDSLLSIVQMPGGIPVGTLAIGKAGAKNAGLLAAQFLANNDLELLSRIEAYRKALSDCVPTSPVD